MAEKAYKFRLYPNKQQEELIRKTCGCARFVYNTTLAARQAAYKAGTPLSGNDCVKMLPGLKVQYPWLKEYGPGLPKLLCLQEWLSQGEGCWFSEV